MNESLHPKYQNYFEDLDEIVGKVRAQAVGLGIKPGEPGTPSKPWPEEEQERLVSLFLAAADEGLTRQGESYELLGKVFPLTRFGRKVKFLEQTGWDLDKTAEGSQQQLDRPRKGDDPNEVCMLPRAPGGEYVPLQPEDCTGHRWETSVSMWIMDMMTREGEFRVTREDIEQLGGEIARNYKRPNGDPSQKNGTLSPEDILLDIGDKPDSYDLTYHYEAISPGHKPHSCGAHAHDTQRAILQMLAQGALLAYATKDREKKKNIAILGRRTATEGTPAEIINPAEVDYTTYAKHFFARGIAPKSQASIDATTRQGGKLFPEESRDDRPTLQTIHTILQATNHSLMTSEERGLVGVYTCSDDRGSSRMTKNHRLILGQSKKHVSNILFFTLGEDAAMRELVEAEGEEIEDRDNPPGVYRDTLVPGCEYPGYKIVAKLKKQLLGHAKLLVQGVMSPEDRTKEIYLIADLGEEPLDVTNKYTEAICNDPEVRARAGIDVTDWPTETLSTDQIKELLHTHEDMTFDAIDKLFSQDLRKVLKEHGLGPGPRNLEIYCKFIRHADQTIQKRFFHISTRD